MPAATVAKKAPMARKTAPATAVKAPAVKAVKTVKGIQAVPPVEPEKATKAKKPLAKSEAKPEAKAAAKKDTTKEKAKKPKMVRDSFTMPEPEYKVLGEVKRACIKAGVEVKKSELLRVGVALLQKLQPEELKAALAALAPIKAGRPKAAK